MGRLISQQAAIEHWRLIIDATSTDSGYNKGFVDGLEFCISHLSTMPSAQPAQSEMIKEIRGWINSGNRGNADYFIVDRIEEIINAYEIN